MSSLRWNPLPQEDGYDRIVAQTEFFSIYLLSHPEKRTTRVRIQTHRSVFNVYPYRYEIRFAGPQVVEMTARFITSIETLEQLMLDYIRMVQEDTDAWIAHEEQRIEDDQSRHAQRESGEGS